MRIKTKATKKAPVSAKKTTKKAAKEVVIVKLPPAMASNEDFDTDLEKVDILDDEFDAEAETTEEFKEEKEEKPVNDFSDEDEEEAEGQYGYGWGYDESLDSFDEVEKESDYLDEDEEFVKGGAAGEEED